MDDVDLFLQAHQNVSKPLPSCRLQTFSSDSDSQLIDQLLQKIPAMPSFSPVQSSFSPIQSSFSPIQPSMASRPLSPTSTLLLRQVPPPVVHNLPPPPVPHVRSLLQGEPAIAELNASEQKLIEMFRNSPVLGSSSPIQSTTSPRFFESSPSGGGRSSLCYKNISPLGDKPLRRPKELDRLDMEANTSSELQRALSTTELKIKELESQLTEERRAVVNLKVKYTGENEQLKRKIESLLEEKLNDLTGFDDTIKKVCKENEALKQSISELNSEKVGLLAEVENLKSDIARLRDENMNACENNRKLSSANIELQMLIAENGRLKEELTTCVSTRATLEACAKTMTEDIKELKKELEMQREAAETERSRMEEEYKNRMRGIRDCFLSGGSEVQAFSVHKSVQPSLPQPFSTKSYLNLERQEQELLTQLLELPSRGLTSNERQCLTIQLKMQLKKVQAEMECMKKGWSAAQPFRDLKRTFWRRNNKQKQSFKDVSRSSGNTNLADEEGRGRPSNSMTRHFWQPWRRTKENAGRRLQHGPFDHRSSSRKGMENGWMGSHELSDNNKAERVRIFTDVLQRNKQTPFLNYLVTGDELRLLSKNLEREKVCDSRGVSPKGIPKGIHCKKALWCVWCDEAELSTGNHL